MSGRRTTIARSMLRPGCAPRRPGWTTEDGVFQMTYVGTQQTVEGAFRIRLEEESDVPADAHSAECRRESSLRQPLQASQAGG